MIPSKVLITAGSGIGGVTSFAHGLASGFSELGIPSEVIAPNEVFKRPLELRDSSTLKVLSTTAVFAAPFAKRVIAVAHGFPRIDFHGWAKLSAILGSFKLANLCNVPLVAVSEYAALHLKSIFNLDIAGVIANPLRACFLESQSSTERKYITYVGNLHTLKNIHKLIPPIIDLLNQHPDLKACVIGDGPLRSELEAISGSRIEFIGCSDEIFVRNRLRESVMLVSGCYTESFGIVYAEALSQGCKVVMPASGGGMEIAPDHFGTSVHLLPLNFTRSEAFAVLKAALIAEATPVAMGEYSAKAIASAYLGIDLPRRAYTGQRATAAH